MYHSRMTALDTYAYRVHVGPRIVACTVYFAMPPPSSSATLSPRKIYQVHSNIPTSSGSVCEWGRKWRVWSSQRTRHWDEPCQQKRLCTVHPNVFTTEADSRVEIWGSSKPYKRLRGRRRHRLASRWDGFEDAPLGAKITITTHARCRTDPPETSRYPTHGSNHPRGLESIRGPNNQISIRPPSETHHTIPSPPPTSQPASIFPTPETPPLPPAVFCPGDSSQDRRSCLDMGMERVDGLCGKVLAENDNGRL